MTETIPTSDPSQAQAVQIPLRSFSLPSFPPETLSATNIRSLTLTSDINLSEYQDLLTKPFDAVPELPRSIEGLTLELFTLGYPRGFLKQLAERLPGLRSLTVFGQLIGGVESGQGDDAMGFFEKVGDQGRRVRMKRMRRKRRKEKDELGKKESDAADNDDEKEVVGGLREVHFIDTFAMKGFWDRVGDLLDWSREGKKKEEEKEEKGTDKGDDDDDPEAEDDGIKLLEVSYTYRHGDEEFLTRIHASDLLGLLHKSLVAVSLNIVPPPKRREGGDAVDDKLESEDPENLDREGKPLQKRPEGVMVLHPTHTPELMEKLVHKWEGPPGGLQMLALTLFTLDTEQVAKVLEKHTGLRVLNVTVSVGKADEWRDKILEVLAKGKNLEVVEVVMSPGLEFYLGASNPKSLTRTLANIFPTKSHMESLGSDQKCRNLTSLEMNILRTTSFGKVEWTREEDGPGADGVDDDNWQGGIVQPEGVVPDQPGMMDSGDVPDELREMIEEKMKIGGSGGDDDDGDGDGKDRGVKGGGEIVGEVKDEEEEEEGKSGSSAAAATAAAAPAAP